VYRRGPYEFVRVYDRRSSASAPGVVFDARNPQVLYANADRVYRSTNGGSDWSPILTPLPNSIKMIAIAPTSTPTLFVGSVLSQDIFGQCCNFDRAGTGGFGTALHHLEIWNSPAMKSRRRST